MLLNETRKWAIPTTPVFPLSRSPRPHAANRGTIEENGDSARGAEAVHHTAWSLATRHVTTVAFCVVCAMKRGEILFSVTIPHKVRRRNNVNLLSSEEALRDEARDKGTTHRKVKIRAWNVFPSTTPVFPISCAEVPAKYLVLPTWAPVLLTGFGFYLWSFVKRPRSHVVSRAPWKGLYSLLLGFRVFAVFLLSKFGGDLLVSIICFKKCRKFCACFFFTVRWN